MDDRKAFWDKTFDTALAALMRQWAVSDGNPGMTKVAATIADNALAERDQRTS